MSRQTARLILIQWTDSTPPYPSDQYQSTGLMIHGNLANRHFILAILGFQNCSILYFDFSEPGELQSDLMYITQMCILCFVCFLIIRRMVL